MRFLKFLIIITILTAFYSGCSDSNDSSGASDQIIQADQKTLTADALSSTEVVLDWSGLSGVSVVEFFDIYMDGSFLYYTGKNMTTYTVRDLTPGTEYCFQIIGVDSSFNTVAQSNKVCLVTGIGPWVPLSVTGAPAERRSHTAIWTGTKMIVWGGYNSGTSTDYNSGGIYDPVTGRWSVVSTTGAPSARSYHTAIWTGTKMIVWGGFNYGTGTDTNSGGIYDPVTDTWSAVSTTGAPSARYYHTAIWTGTKMIVWGGYSGASGTNSGGIYDPETDTWSPVSTTGTPAERRTHTAIWTGTKMIVWGGFNGTTYLNSGGIYDPVTDIWSPVSTTGAPSARSYYTAIWTGTKMVVWGGLNSTMYLNSGGIYDLVTDIWSPVSITGAPSARRDHTAIWTGTDIIVWGGYNGSIYYNTGALLRFVND